MVNCPANQLVMIQMNLNLDLDTLIHFYVDFLMIPINAHTWDGQTKWLWMPERTMVWRTKTDLTFASPVFAVADFQPTMVLGRSSRQHTRRTISFYVRIFCEWQRSVKMHWIRKTWKPYLEFKRLVERLTSIYCCCQQTGYTCLSNLAKSKFQITCKIWRNWWCMLLFCY